MENPLVKDESPVSKTLKDVMQLNALSIDKNNDAQTR